MALELPGWLVTAFYVIGLPWPGIDEDELRAWATSVRGFASSVTGNSAQTSQNVAALNATSQSEFTTVLAGRWERRNQLVADLRGPIDDFADALDGAADVVVAQKYACIAALAALATEFAVTQVGAFLSFGLDEAAVPAEILSTRELVKFALEYLEAELMGKLIGVAAQEVTDHVNRFLGNFLNDSMSVAFEAQSLKISYGSLREAAASMRGQATQTEETGNAAYSENAGRELEGSSEGGAGDGGRWAAVMQAVEQALLDIAGDLFKSLPAVIFRAQEDDAAAIENAAAGFQETDAKLSGEVPDPELTPAPELAPAPAVMADDVPAVPDAVLPPDLRDGLPEAVPEEVLLPEGPPPPNEPPPPGGPSLPEEPERGLKPWPADPESGYVLQERDLAFLGITLEQIGWWRAGEAPLGMRPEQFDDFSDSLADELAAHGVSAGDFEADLVGSSVRVFSGWTKRLDNIPMTPEIESRLGEWFGDDENRPVRRPFDSTYKLGASDKPSDYDVNIRSDRMVEMARQQWLDSGAEDSFSHPRQGFVDPRIVAETFPELAELSQLWKDELGRKVSFRLFGLDEEPVQRRAAQSSGGDSVWRIHPRQAPTLEPQGMRPWPEDPVSGYRLQTRDLRFLGISIIRVKWWRSGEAPLGMTPRQYTDFRSSLADALRSDGVTTGDTDIRLKGSSINIFSNRRKALPTEGDLAGKPESAALLRQWLSDDPARPASRPFDSMYKLGLSDRRSDYDIQIRSDQMVELARRRYEADPSQQLEPFAHDKYNFVAKQIVREQFPALHRWAQRWQDEFGREVNPALFGLEGEPRQSTDPERLKRGWPIVGRDVPRAGPS